MICAAQSFQNRIVAPVKGRACPAWKDRLEQALGSRRFLRSPLVWSEDLDAIVQHAKMHETPLPILLLWGKGPKCSPDRAEDCAGKLLSRYAETIAPIWPSGLRYFVLFADTHAAANGYEFEESRQYFDAVRAMLGSTNFEFRLLSEIWLDGGLSWSQIQDHAGSLDESNWRPIAKRLQLVSAAGRHSCFGGAEQAARIYFAMRVLENRILSRRFARFVYATSDGPDRQALCPNLPVLHLYSMARGRCAKPWFTRMPYIGNPEAAEVPELCVA